MIYRAGIEFVEPSERVSSVIGDFIEARQRPPGSVERRPQTETTTDICLRLSVLAVKRLFRFGIVFVRRGAA